MFLKRLQNAREVFENAQNLSTALAMSVSHIEAGISSIDDDVARFERYIGREKMATSADLALASLRERRVKLESSHETLRALSTVVGEKLQDAKGHLQELEAFVRDALSEEDSEQKPSVAE